jgi:hypothetical protein
MKQPTGKRSETWQSAASSTTSPSTSARHKELIMDYRKRRAEHATLHIDRAIVATVSRASSSSVSTTPRTYHGPNTVTVVKRVRTTSLS